MTTRRTTLGSLLALAAVSACDVDDLRPPEDDPVPSGPGESPQLDADGQLVQAVVVEIVQTLGFVERMRRRAPTLREDMKQLSRMHRAHLAVLDPAGQGLTSAVAPKSGGLRKVRTREEALQRRLASSAVEARSGSLARLLASMSAAVAQQLADFPPEAGSGVG